MGEKKEDTDNPFGLHLGEWAVWDMESPDHECDCPGPPPHFYLPPPPRPPSVPHSDCSENYVSELETCEAVPVIDAEYHYSPAIPSLAVIVIVAVAVLVFLFIGTILVVLKKRKVQNLLPRKSSPHNHCDATTANGVIYEDLTNNQPRALPPLCPPPRTTLPSSIEMIDIPSCPDHRVFGPTFICPSSPVIPDSYNSQELFNPVYEELSNGSGERGESDSEGTAHGPSSEDEFAEDELSVGENRGESDNNSMRGSTGNDLCKDMDSSDADDRSKFLENPKRNFSLPPEFRDKRRKGSRDTHFYKKTKNSDRKRGWGKNESPMVVIPPLNYTDFHEGLLLETVLQFYPNVDSTYPRQPPHTKDSSSAVNPYETIPPSAPSYPHRPKPEIFTTFRASQSSGKNQSQDSSFGSDSGYSNNTSGGKTSKIRKNSRLSNESNVILS